MISRKMRTLSLTPWSSITTPEHRVVDGFMVALKAFGYIRERDLNPNTMDRLIIVPPAGHAVLDDDSGVA